MEREERADAARVELQPQQQAEERLLQGQRRALHCRADCAIARGTRVSKRSRVGGSGSASWWLEPRGGIRSCDAKGTQPRSSRHSSAAAHAHAHTTQKRSQCCVSDATLSVRSVRTAGAYL